MNLARLILICGVLHFGILLASALVPQVLDWKTSLEKLDKLSRQLIWVHGAFIVLVIVGFGLISVSLSPDLAGGSLLARGICLFIALFWGTRLAVQLFVFDAKPYLRTAILKAGYHALTGVFGFMTLVYATAAIAPR